MVWDGIPGVMSQIHPSPKLKWRSSRIAHESNLWKLYEIVFKKLTIKCICNVLFDFCVTHWMCEVCWTKVRRRLWNNSATPIEQRNPSCLQTYLIGSRVLCVLHIFLLFEIATRLQMERGFFPRPKYHILTETLYSGSRRNTWYLFPCCTQRTYKNFGYQSDTETSKNVLTRNYANLYW